MSATNSQGTTAAVAAVAVSPTRQRRFRRFVGKFPLFVLPVLLYVIIALSVLNVRRIFVTVGPYSFTWVETIYFFAFLIAMFEILRVAKPGIDNTWEALRMGIVFMAMLIFFVLGAAGAIGFRIFNTSEFLVLLLVSAAQVGLAFLINAATLKRSIDYTDGH